MTDAAGSGVPDVLLRQLDEIDLDLVMVLCTARRRDAGVQRLPDREDRGQQVAAVQVETAEQAAFVMERLDRPGRHFYVDVERKQDVDLMAAARSTVTQGTVSGTKPNDTTVDALSATLTEHIGADHRDRRVTIIGTGNLGFKFAVRLAEEGAAVALVGRDEAKAELLAGAINAVLPRHTPHKVRVGPHPDGTELLVAAVTAAGVVTTQWLDRLAPGALCIDVGIGNLTPDFIEGAHEAGHRVCRLDVRAAGDPLLAHPNTFFTTIAGERQLDGVRVVSGGMLGGRGDVVVDRISPPVRVLGIADGQGGLVPSQGLSAYEAARLAHTRSTLTAQEHPASADAVIGTA